MVKIGIKIMLFLSFFLFLISSLVGAQPTEKALIEKWEMIQREDTKTVVFQKVDEGLYKFKTERFPYDGQLKVLNIIIDDRMSNFEYGYIIGIIEVELLDLPEDFIKKYSQSYSIWAQNNTLYYDAETNRWLSNREHFAKTTAKAKEFPFWRGSLWNFFDPALIILVIFLIILLFVSRRMQKENRKYMDSVIDSTRKSLELNQKALALSEKSSKILEGILEVLKKK